MLGGHNQASSWGSTLGIHEPYSPASQPEAGRGRDRAPPARHMASSLSLSLVERSSERVGPETPCPDPVVMVRRSAAMWAAPGLGPDVLRVVYLLSKKDRRAYG